MSENNYLVRDNGDPLRTSQVAWVMTPRVFLFEDDKISDLQTQVNDFIDSQALPFNPDFRFFVRDILYDSAEIDKKKTRYSVLIHAETYVPL